MSYKENTRMIASIFFVYINPLSSQNNMIKKEFLEDFFRILALGPLRSLTGFLQTRLLALHNTRIASQKPCLLECRAQFC